MAAAAEEMSEKMEEVFALGIACYACSSFLPTGAQHGTQSVPRGLVNNQNLVLNPKLRIVWEHIAYQLIRFKPFYLRIVIISVHPNIDLKVSRNLLQNMSCAGERWMRIALSLALPSKPRVHAAF